MSSPIATHASDVDASALELNTSLREERLVHKAGGPIRILHVVDRLDVGGTEKGIEKVANGLDPDLFQHSICTLRGTTSVARSWMPKITITDLSSDVTGFQFNLLRLARIMRAVRPTIVHSRNWGGIEASLAARLAGVPVIIHSEHGYQLDMKNGLPLRQRGMRRVAYGCAHAVFTVSSELREFHAAQAWWSAKSIGVLHNGVDTDKFSPSLEVSRRIRLQLGIDRDEPVVGFVGRLIALKDVKTLLLALERVMADLPGVQAMIVGSGPELERLQSQVTGSERLRGRVRFVGVREDVADLLKAMDIFVLPSLMEGMSNTLLEAMSTGLPVVATKVGGNPEVVSDLRCGYLFEPGDVAGLADQLAGLLRSREQRERFGQEARERVIDRFSLRGMLGRYRDLYRELAKRAAAAESVGTYVWN